MKKLILILSLALVSCGNSVFDDMQDVTYHIQMSYGACSAVAIKPDTLLTAGHCGELNEAVAVYDGKKFIGYGKFIRKSDKADLALIHVWYREVPLNIAYKATRGPEMHDQVFTVGYPLSIAEVLTRGFYVGVANNHYLVSISVIFGNSGGGLFNEHGELIGIGSWVVVSQAGVIPLAGFVTLADINKFLENEPRSSEDTP